MSDPMLLPPRPPPASLAKARAAMLAELSKPRTRWTTHLARLLLASLGLAASIITVMISSGAEPASRLISRWVSLLLLGAAAPLLAIAAARPGSKNLRFGAIATAFAAMISMIITRPAHLESISSSPEWTCTVWHLAAALPAIGLSVLLMKSMAFDRLRSIALGLGVGTTGALMGEVMCTRDAGHVAVFHLAAWGLVALIITTLATFTRRSTFAP